MIVPLIAADRAIVATSPYRTSLAREYG